CNDVETADEDRKLLKRAVSADPTVRSEKDAANREIAHAICGMRSHPTRATRKCFDKSPRLNPKPYPPHHRSVPRPRPTPSGTSGRNPGLRAKEQGGDRTE